MIEVYLGLFFLMRDGTFTTVVNLSLEEAATCLSDYMTGDEKTRKAIACSGYMITSDRARSVSVEYGGMPRRFDILKHLQNYKKYHFDDQVENGFGFRSHIDETTTN